MSTQHQQQRRAKGKERVNKHTVWIRWGTASILFLLIAIGTLSWVLSDISSWTTILPVVLFTVLGVVIGLLQWLFPTSSDTPNHTKSANFAVHHIGQSFQADPSEALIPSGEGVSDIVHTHLLPSPIKPAYRGIVGVVPPTDPRSIQQRRTAVKEIYAKLIQQNTTAVVLTGMGGIGKSTLAALVYRYVEELRMAGNGPFRAQAIWLHIDSATTMVDLAGNLFASLGKPLPDFNNLSLQHQALTLVNTLNTGNEARLVVLDQFENLLDWQTGHALADRPGVGEWLDAINSQACLSRVLLTSRPWPRGTRGYPPTHTQEYRVSGLDLEEGIELLHTLGLDGRDEELRTVVQHCEGHAFALTLLASFLRSRNLSLSTFFKDAAYAQIWTGNVARNLLDSIYHQQLSAEQRGLLLALSVYREPVPLEAAQAIVDVTDALSKTQLQSNIDILLTQHLLEASGEGRYQLHAIVSNYAQTHLKGNEQANQRAWQTAHTKAACYYAQAGASQCPAKAERRQISDIQPLIEAAWHWCKAEEWQEAYALMEKEDFFLSLRRWGGSATLLELCQLLIPVERWHAQRVQEAHIYNNLGVAHRTLGRIQQAQKHLEYALHLFHEENARVGESQTHNNLGRVYEDMGDNTRAQKEFEQALYISLAEADREGEGLAYNYLGSVCLRMGQSEEASVYYKRALDIFKDIRDYLWESTVLNNLGSMYEYLEDEEQAREYCQQALTIAQEIGDRRVEACTLNNLGKVHGKLGQNTQGLKYLEQALAIRRDIDRRGEGRTLRNLGEIYDKLGQIQSSRECYKTGLSIAQEVGDREGEGKILQCIGIHYLKQMRYDVALAFLLRAEEVFNEVQSLYGSKTRQKIETLVNENALSEVFARVKPQINNLVEQALREGF